ncbi:MAG: lipoprotein-releasing ABC transporter permease subunit [Alphaproteobacteria bacterium]
MFSRFELLTAWRYVRSKKDDNFISVVSWFALVGIILGVCALVLVMSVMGGFRQELLMKVLGINGHVTLSNGANSITNYKVIEKQLQGYKDIRSATGYLQKSALLSAGSNSRGIIVRGVRVRSLKDREIFKTAISKNDLRNFETGQGVLIGKRLSRNYGIYKGDSIALMIPDGDVNALIPKAKVKKYKVVGYFEVGMYRYDNGMIFMPLHKAQKFFGIKGVTQIEATLDDADKANDWVAKHENKFKVKYVDAWARVNSSFFNALEVERNTMFIILSVMILIAVFNIITGQIMIVKDHKKSIAILRTLGVSRFSIIKIFFIVGSFIGLIGTFLGLGLGVLVADNLETIRIYLKNNFGVEIFNPEIYHLNQIPIVYNENELTLIVIYSIALSLLAGLYPAIRAGRMNPVQGLRND